MAGAGDNTNNKKKSIAAFFPSEPVYKVLVIVMALLAIAFLAMIAIVKAFPAGLTMALIAVMFVMFILSWFLMGRGKRPARICGLLVAVLFLAGYGLATYYLGTTYTALAKMTAGNEANTADSGFDISKDAFNVYITGIDMWNHEKGLDLERSDVNMIVTVCPETRKILLTSIPRDSYVKLHTAGQMDKLTHTGVYGVDETLNTVHDWLGVDLNYYVKVNFTSVMKIISAIGGIRVESPKAFESSISKYKYKKGWNNMGGKKALYFARERKAFNNEDAIRVENQQRVFKAVLDKMTTSSTLLTKYDDLLAIAADDLETNMPMSDMQKLVRMQLADLRTWDIQSQKITGEYDMDYVASLTQEQKFQIYRTDSDSVADCVKNINAVMNPTAEELEQVEEEKMKANFINFLRNLSGGNNTEEESEE